jgi:DNA repair ATPase RecN
MSGKSAGFFVTKLAVSGPGKPDAELVFTDGLNVVSGASDTGKSFALSCIDFAFGARHAPRSIPEVVGYRAVSLHLTARASHEQIIIERALAGGDVRVVRKDIAGNVVEDSVIPFKHNAKEASTLSGVLLQLTELWGHQVRKNAKGERRSLSFRDVAYLCVVDEERIIAERPPHLSDSYTERTVESEVFRMLITGNESGEVIVVPGKKDIAGIEAKLELVGSMIESSQADFQKTGLKETELDTELTAIEETRGKALAEYERARLSVTELEGTLKEHSHSLREAQTRLVVVEGLIKRFQLLDAHYVSNIQRLATIEETGSLLTALPSQACPVCGAPPEAHRLEHGGEQYQPAVVQSAALTESAKVKALKKDLGRVLSDLIAERNQLQTRADEAAAAVTGVQSQISRELTPRVTESAQALELENGRRDILLRTKGITENIAKLRCYVVDLEAMRAAGKTASPRIAATATTAEMDTFARAVEGVLGAWKYPSPGRVIFSETDQDLIIGGNSRASHGKGVRALTCAAFIIGVMKHCRSKELPHPSLVVLDSPLVAYQEPDSADGEIQKLLQAGVKDAFYSTLASGLADGQVIVFENEDPPLDLRTLFTRHHFTKTNLGRYGFFPRK